MDLYNKVIVITGASSGIGEAIARQSSQAGAYVVVTARSTERLQKLANELGASAGRALAVSADITIQTDIQRLAVTTLQHFGHVDILVNSAGFGIVDPFIEARVEDFREMVDVNICGSILCTQIFLPYMLRQRSGHIVIMSSIAGLIGFINMSLYGATKFALVGIAQSLMLELAGTGVACTLMCPGPAQTHFTKRACIRKYSRATRLVPWLTANEVASATIVAIQRGIHGKVIIPWQGRLLVRLANLFPLLAHVVLRTIR